MTTKKTSKKAIKTSGTSTPPAKAPLPAPPVKTPAKLAAAKYQELLENAVEMLKLSKKARLRAGWTVGKAVIELTDRPDNYGNRTLQTFAEDLSSLVGDGIEGNWSESTLKKARLVAKAFDADSLGVLVDRNITWTEAVAAAAKKIDPVQRKQLVEDLRTGEKLSPTSKRLLAAAKRGGTKSERLAAKTEPGTPLSILKGMAGLFEMVSQKIGGASAQAEAVFKGGDADAMRKAAEYIDEAADMWRSLKRTADSEVESCVETARKGLLALQEQS